MTTNRTLQQQCQALKLRFVSHRKNMFYLLDYAIGRRKTKSLYRRTARDDARLLYTLLNLHQQVRETQDAMKVLKQALRLNKEES